MPSRASARWFFVAVSSIAAIGAAVAAQSDVSVQSAESARGANALERFRALPADLRREVIEGWRAEVSAEGGALSQRIASALALGDGRRPQLARPPRWFDPKVHAPAQPIPRRLARPDEAPHPDMAERIEARHPPRPERAGYAWDFGRGVVVRTSDADDPERIFANGLLGRPPEWDLAEALVIGALDDGSQRAALEAFGHAYTTRDGVVFPDVTLYDAWSSGLENEMPDVDVLGIVHTVLRDTRTFVAPIPASLHAPLYAKLHEVFQPARRLKSLAQNVARAHAWADPVVGDGFVPSQAQFFHALWADAGEDPKRARAMLPALDAPDWNSFAGAWVRRLAAEPELLEATRARRAELAADAARVRELLLAALERAEERAPRRPADRPRKP